MQRVTSVQVKDLDVTSLQLAQLCALQSLEHGIEAITRRRVVEGFDGS
jgi:hypothetical protein